VQDLDHKGVVAMVLVCVYCFRVCVCVCVCAHRWTLLLCFTYAENFSEIYITLHACM